MVGKWSTPQRVWVLLLGSVISATGMLSYPRTAHAVWACSESDAGTDPYLAGTTVVSELETGSMVASLDDVCLGDQQLREYFCAAPNGYAQSVVHTCGELELCVGGRCASEYDLICQDEDHSIAPGSTGGNVLSEFFISDLLGGDFSSADTEFTVDTDSCSDASHVREWYCADEQPSLLAHAGQLELECPEGTGCAFGACMPESVLASIRPPNIDFSCEDLFEPDPPFDLEHAGAVEYSFDYTWVDGQGQIQTSRYPGGFVDHCLDNERLVEYGCAPHGVTRFVVRCALEGPSSDAYECRRDAQGRGACLPWHGGISDGFQSLPDGR